MLVEKLERVLKLVSFREEGKRLRLRFQLPAYLVFETVAVSIFPRVGNSFITTPITFNLNFTFISITFHVFVALLSFLANSLFLFLYLSLLLAAQLYTLLSVFDING